MTTPTEQEIKLVMLDAIDEAENDDGRSVKISFRDARTIVNQIYDAVVRAGFASWEGDALIEREADGEESRANVDDEAPSDE